MRYTDALLDSLRQVGDPQLDPIITQLVLGKGLEAVNQVLRAAVTNEGAVPSALPDDLRTWLASAARVPDGVDRQRIERACTFFVDHGVSLSAILGLASLPECYAAKKGVKALHATDQMGYGGTEKRVSETSQFVLRVMAPGGLYEDGSAIATLMKVRMMHSASRILIGQHDWDTANDGVPINQEDLIGTLTTFGYTPLVHITKLGVKVSAQEADDFWYFWRVAGQMLGVDPTLIPESVAEAKVYFERVQQRHRGKSNEGIELTRALLKLYANLVPGAKLFDGLVPGVIRFLAGDEVSDVLEVPASRWTGFIQGNRVVFRLLNAVQERSSIVNSVVNTLGLKILTHEAIRIGGGRHAEFKIPEAIRRAWRLPPHGTGPRTTLVIGEITRSIATQIGSSESAARTVFELAALVANADGEIDELEEAGLVETLAALGLAGDLTAARARIQASVVAMRKDGTEARAVALGKALETLRIRDEGLALAIAMAYANSGIAAEERALIERLAKAAGLADAALERLVQQTRERIETAAVA